MVGVGIRRQQKSHLTIKIKDNKKVKVLKFDRGVVRKKTERTSPNKFWNWLTNKTLKRLLEIFLKR